MKTYRKILAVIMCVVITLSAAPLGGLVGLELPSLFDFKAEAATYSGTCGDNLTWSLDTSTGVLEISGTGEMYDWGKESSVPWYSYRWAIDTIEMGNEVTNIGHLAFYRTSVTSIIIPDSVIDIDSSAFAECSDLENVTIGSNVTSIGASSFYSCDSLTSVTIPDSVITIGYQTFYHCDNLANVTIGSGVTNIGEETFRYCIRLQNITVDENNQYYSSDNYGVLFNKNKSVLIQYPVNNIRNSYTIPDSVTTINDDAFEFCNDLTSVTIGKNVKTIGEGAFNRCSNLTSITIPDSVTTIGYAAFSRCESLTSVTIGKNVTTIDDRAFIDCNIITDVYYGSTETMWSKIIIGYDNQPILNATIHFTEPPHIHSYISSVMTSATCTKEGELLYTCDCGDSYTEIIPRKEHTAGEWEIVLKPTIEADGKKIKKCKVCGIPVEEQVIEKITEPEFDEAIILTPSQSIINYGDSIVHHIDVEIIPEGGYVEWTASNGNFANSVSEDGSTCKITSSVSGDTIFIAVVYDEDGRPIFTDEQVMTSKAGFFQKLISFFKNLFGISRIILQSFDY